MKSLSIRGGRRLSGQVKISGAKNAALPILAATLLCGHRVDLANVPHLKDIATLMSLLSQMGMKVTLNEDHGWSLDGSGIHSVVAPYELVSQMRASILVLGPLLARFGEAKVSLPGGCAIGSRPIDRHLKALEALGAKFVLEDGYVHGTVSGRLKGGAVHFDDVTVTGTENAIMAAVLAEGITTITNAATEPEVADLCYFLKQQGAKISQIACSTLIIEGVKKLTPAKKPYPIVFDRIEAGTYLAAAIMTRGEITIEQVTPGAMVAIIEQLQKFGADLRTTDHSVHISMNKRPIASSFKTTIYPGFPTDMQAQCMAINAVAKGESRVTETIFENRFMHVQELNRLGARIDVAGRDALIKGVAQLYAAPVMATDLRASASLVLAALAAQGVTEISRIYHLCRGYERIEEKLSHLGADIRIEEVISHVE